MAMLISLVNKCIFFSKLVFQYLYFLLKKNIQEEGGIEYVDKTDAAKGGGGLGFADMADKGGRGLANADIG